MTSCNRGRLAVLLLFLLFLFQTAVQAAPAADPSRDGSLTITQSHEGESVPGGAYTLYLVARAEPASRTPRYALTDGFSDCGEDLSDPENAALALRLAGFAHANALTGVTQEVDAWGKVCFDALTSGLYLVVQTAAPEGYYAASAFLAAVPVYEDGWNYDLTAAPKLEPAPASADPSDPPVGPSDPSADPSDPPTGPSDPPGAPSDPPAEPSDPPGDPAPTPPAEEQDPEDTLIQTGQMNWPVPVLAVAGLLLFTFGWVLLRRESRL